MSLSTLLKGRTQFQKHVHNENSENTIRINDVMQTLVNSKRDSWYTLIVGNFGVQCISKQ